MRWFGTRDSCFGEGRLSPVWVEQKPWRAGPFADQFGRNFRITDNRGIDGDKEIRQSRQDSVAGYTKRLRISYLRCLNRLCEAPRFAGAQSLVSLTWPRSMQRSRAPQYRLSTRAIHRGGP